ncbi:MAG: glycoside hydrolase family 125 protein [Anaerolineae bacterium]
MTLFDLSDYHVRQLDPAQGTKPLDFGGGGITGSVNLDGRFIAINTYHPEHGYITLTSIPPFTDADRYDQAKVRAYRKSLVTNEGFGLQFEQEIIKREYFLIEDAVPFIRFTLADGTIAECVSCWLQRIGMYQFWKFSSNQVYAQTTGHIWIQRAAYTQLTEGGIINMPSNLTQVKKIASNYVIIENISLEREFRIYGVNSDIDELQNGLHFQQNHSIESEEFLFGVMTNQRNVASDVAPQNDFFWQHFIETIGEQYFVKLPDQSLVINRAATYGRYCENGMLTDHMILPLVWTRDSYYVVRAIDNYHKSTENSYPVAPSHIKFLFLTLWRGTYCKSGRQPIAFAWGRAFMRNGMPKDNKSFQLDQQLYPFLLLAEYLLETGSLYFAKDYIHEVKQLFFLLNDALYNQQKQGLYPTDETPADDDIPLHFHFSTHILLWHTMKKLRIIYSGMWEGAKSKFEREIEKVEKAVPKYFITEHKGKKIYAYATDGEGNFYLYHDANDIPLVMMPLWGFCDKDNEIWLNTIEFAFSDDNPGFYDGVLGSVHSPAPWSLGDAQELIFCKVVGDRDRYQRVWERVEKVAQWDGALPEAYNISDYSVYSRHWFAWPNAMIAIADSISWNWETEGEYAR